MTFAKSFSNGDEEVKFSKSKKIENGKIEENRKN